MSIKITSEKCEVECLLDGAMLHSLKKNNTEYLWQGDEEHWAGQAPVCFPICGVLVDGKGTAFGKHCSMKRHGVARINEFKVKEQGKNFVTFIQKSNEKTKEDFPFDYSLEIKYTINGSTVTTEYTVLNTGKGKLPFVIGGHPAFNCPLSSGEKFEDYKVVFDKVMIHKCLRPNHKTGLVDINERFDVLNNTDTINMEHSLFEENDAMIFDNVQSKSATLIGLHGLGIKVEFQDMNNLLIWSATNNAPFVALEPWTGISNCSDENEVLENKRGMTILDEDEMASFKFKITMI